MSTADQTGAVEETGAAEQAGTVEQASAAEPAGTEPAGTEPAGTEQADAPVAQAPEQPVTEPAASEPAASEPAASEPQQDHRATAEHTPAAALLHSSALPSLVPGHAPVPAGLTTAARGSDWGRVTDEGTVYVRTADGEREVGSWKAGSPQDGLAHFARRYEQLATEVALLEQRLASGAGDPSQIASSARRLKETVPTASAVGDLAGLERRVDGLLERTAGAVEAAKAARAEQRAGAVAKKTALAEEAEGLAGSSEWKTAGERLRTLGEDWKRITGVDKKTDQELWDRVAAARKRFAERRTTHFGALEQQREVSKGRKERLIAQAEELSSSTDWRATADRYKQLMSDWKTAGRAPREVEDALWARFKAAQDVFFTARSAQFAEQDVELRGNQEVKEQILAEAEALDPSQGRDKATKRLRELQERWEAAGKVPRDVMRSLEDRMGKVEEKFRQVSDQRFAQASESPFVVRLREKVGELEAKLAKAQAAGRPTEELEAQLSTQRAWLSQAGASAGPGGQERRPEARRTRSTTAWVRSDS